MTNTELASSYAALILADSKHKITPEKINAITSAAGVKVEPIWAKLLAKVFEGKSVKDLLVNIGSSRGTPTTCSAHTTVCAPAERKERMVEEVVEEDDDDAFCFSLYD
ncbi:hypothetical protein FRB93_010419 [Tulasnella sp. JGI-2019a]|nr:hypothetical protein FRB93_010419 [Tulasnella sp. JGI-2019a]